MARCKSHQSGVSLIILELAMPRMDGRALQVILVLNPEARRVILSSGYRGHKAIQHSQDEGLVRKYVKSK